MTIAQLQSLITLALSKGLTTSDLVFAQNDTVAVPASAVVPLGAGYQLIALGQYQEGTGSEQVVQPARGLYVGLAG